MSILRTRSCTCFRCPRPTFSVSLRSFSAAFVASCERRGGSQIREKREQEGVEQVAGKDSVAERRQQEQEESLAEESKRHNEASKIFSELPRRGRL